MDTNYDRFEELSRKDYLTVDEFKELGHYRMKFAIDEARLAC